MARPATAATAAMAILLTVMISASLVWALATEGLGATATLVLAEAIVRLRSGAKVIGVKVKATPSLPVPIALPMAVPLARELPPEMASALGRSSSGDITGAGQLFPSTSATPVGVAALSLPLALFFPFPLAEGAWTDLEAMGASTESEAMVSTDFEAMGSSALSETTAVAAGAYVVRVMELKKDRSNRCGIVTKVVTHQYIRIA